MGCPNTMRTLKGRLVVVRTYGLVAILAQPKSIHSEGETSSNLVDVFFLFIIIQSYYILSKQDVWVYYSTKPENVYNRPFEGETSEKNNKLRQSKLNCRFWRSDWLVRTKKIFFDAWWATRAKFDIYRKCLMWSEHIGKFFWKFIRTYGPDFRKFSSGLLTYNRGSSCAP